MMAEALRSYLLAAPSITDLVGSRVTWGIRARGAVLPAIVLHLIDANPDYRMGGASGLVESRVQADCWAEQYGDAVRVSRALASTLGGLRATLGTTSVAGLFIDAARDLYDEQDDANELMHRVAVDFQIWYCEGE
jgi:hypothetical protein